ncbi:MAG TPA: hypothetical protein VJR89_03600 [Polyangiales bacterium]|nr:hypothetical protein [Polyangiales bacterium]
MKDPTPWANQDMSELERRLLEAARGDQVPEALQLRMSEALASLPPPAAATGAASSLFSSVGIWGTLSVLMIAGVVGWQLRAAQPSAPPRAPAPVMVAPPIAAEPAALPVVEAPVVEPPVAPTKALAPVPARPARSLSEELALLDEARSALAASSAERAAKLLDQHARQFPRPGLGPESEALRIEVLVAQGQTQRASRLAQRFLDRYPAHPLAARIAAAR